MNGSGVDRFGGALQDPAELMREGRMPARKDEAKRLEAVRARLRQVKADPEPALETICEEIARLPKPELLMNDLFEVLERLPEAFLGAPGPVIRILEHMTGYEERLRDSVSRAPNPHTLVMMFRIVNSSGPAQEKTRWLRLIRRIAKDCSLDYLAEEALTFLSERELWTKAAPRRLRD
jgi:hypothetical protein